MLMCKYVCNPRPFFPFHPFTPTHSEKAQQTIMSTTLCQNANPPKNHIEKKAKHKEHNGRTSKKSSLPVLIHEFTLNGEFEDCSDETTFATAGSLGGGVEIFSWSSPFLQKMDMAKSPACLITRVV